MAAEEGVFPRFSFGTTITDIFGIIGRNFLVLSAIALLLYGLPSAIFAVILMDYMTALFTDPALQNPNVPLNFDFLGTIGITAVVGGIVSIIIAIVTQGALIWAALHDLEGGKPEFGAAFRAGLRFFFPILGFTLIFYVMVGAVFAVPFMLFAGGSFGFGFTAIFLLSIPLLFFLLVVFIGAAPAIVAERCGPIDGMSRSWELTAGHRWKLLAMILIFGIVLMIVSSTISGATMPFTMVSDMDPANPFAGMTAIFAIQSFLSALTLIFTYPAIAATYHNLRNAKEGIRTEQVADIFE